MHNNIIRDSLTNLKRSSQWIKNVRLYLGKSGVAYNADNYPLGSRQDITSDEYAAILARRNTNSKLLYFHKDLVMRKYTAYSDLAVVEMAYDTNTLKDYISDYLFDKESEFMLRINHSDYILHDITDPSMQKHLLSKKESAQETYRGCVIFSCRLPYIDGTLYQVVPKAVLFHSSYLATIYTLVYTIIVFFCVSLFFLGTYRLIHRPLKELLSAFDQLKNANFKTQASVPPTTDFDYLFDRFNSMTNCLNQLIQKEYTQQLLIQKAELKQLQAQINPHFLYNSFFLLNQMINRGLHEESIEVSSELGKYFQYITRTESDITTLEEEYKHAVIYCNIQGKRFEHRILLVIDPLPESFKTALVPKLILQPVLENAFQHGMCNKEKNGIVRMRMAATDAYLSICIDDNGEELKDATIVCIGSEFDRIQKQTYDEDYTALPNIYKRLYLYYGFPDTMKVQRSDLGGMCVTLLLSKEKGPNTNVQTADHR